MEETKQTDEEKKEQAEQPVDDANQDSSSQESSGPKTGPLGEEQTTQSNESPVPEELSEEPDQEKEIEPPFEPEKDIEPSPEEIEEDIKEEIKKVKQARGPLDNIKPLKVAEEEEPEKEQDAKKEEKKEDFVNSIFAVRTTANREDQVMDFITSNIEKKKELKVYSVIRPHGMRGYIFVEAATKNDAEIAAQNIPYARGVLPKPVDFSEMEHMLEQVKHEVDIRKNDIAEIIAGPFKREQCKVTRIDKGKEEVVVELLEAAVPIPITVKMDAVKVIRREGEEQEAD